MQKETHILLGVCGSIAAYKSALLVRQLVQQDYMVQVVMTKAATRFITPLTLSTLSKNPVYDTFFASSGGVWHNHVALGRRADAFLIAPATAHTMAKMGQGLCDNLLTAIYLSATCPVMVAPAMDKDMYAHPATRKNMKLLEERGVHLIPPDAGELASGLEGEGRMAEPQAIMSHLQQQLPKKKSPKR